VTGDQVAARSRKVSPAEAARILAEFDPVVARLVAEVGLPSFARPTETHFTALVRPIIYQQLAGPAARAIYGRMVTALGGEITPEALLAISPEDLRTAGLSGNKTLSVKDLAAKVLDGTVVLDSRRLARESNEEIVARLTTVRGIGRWSAEMFLLFQLRRLDVWPTGDLVVRKGFALAWDIAGEPPSSTRAPKPARSPADPARPRVKSSNPSSRTDRGASGRQPLVPL
jgi:DNA-3-methyladenine glycosylase II